MQTFIMLTRLSPEAAKNPPALEKLERKVIERIKDKCSGVQWVASYAVLGGCDYLDVFEAEGIEMASKVSALIRTEGHATTEVWAATEWERFKALMHDL